MSWELLGRWVALALWVALATWQMLCRLGRRRSARVFGPGLPQAVFPVWRALQERPHE